jgi:hypothetical protein
MIKYMRGMRTLAVGAASHPRGVFAGLHNWKYVGVRLLAVRAASHPNGVFSASIIKYMQEVGLGCGDVDYLQ